MKNRIDELARNVKRQLNDGKEPATPVVHKISDKSMLVWERYYGSMQAAASMMNQAITNTQNVLAVMIIEAEGFSPETHVFNMDKLVIVERPKAEE